MPSRTIWHHNIDSLVPEPAKSAGSPPDQLLTPAALVGFVLRQPEGHLIGPVNLTMPLCYLPSHAFQRGKGARQVPQIVRLTEPRPFELDRLIEFREAARQQDR
jgi:hypothetical protein